MSNKSKLLWKCRRGTRELDLLLSRFVEECYPDLDDAARQSFEELLDEADPDIYNWIMGRDEPANPVYKPLLEKLKYLNGDRA